MAALLDLQPETRAGQQLVARLASLAEQLSRRAIEHDTAGTFAFENVALLKQAGAFTASIPEQFGGQGVDSARDILVASSRLARADASTTIGLNMHLLVVSNMVRRWRIATRRGDERRAASFGRSLERIVRDEVVIAAAVSEPNQHLTQPSTRAKRDAEGWRLNGRKIFGTLSPAATELLVSTTYEGPDGNLMYGYAEVPTDAPGVTINDDWDALGMRASGSNSITLTDVHVAESAVRGGFPVGSTVGYIERNFANGLFHAAASLGLAESAYACASRRLAGQAEGCVRASEQTLIAETSITLAAVRASFDRAARLIDTFDCAHLDVDPTPDEWTSVFAEIQAAKTFINSMAASVVDRALTLSGGAGYTRTHDLSRAYRDVRAGAFMQPLGAVRAHDFLADVALGREPSLN